MFLIRTCPGCDRGRPANGRPFCARCAARVQMVGPISGLPGLVGGALFHYEGPVRRAIVAAKHGARSDVFRDAAGELAVLAANISAGCEQPELVTWVPASRQGRRTRGFDQGRLMAGVVGSRLRIPARRVLTGRRGSQLGRDRAARLASEGWQTRGAVSGPVLLVDDVITTGASMVSAADALRSAGASAVFGVAIAWAASAEELAAGRPTGSGRYSGPFAPVGHRASG